jgi:cytochrome c-type biogenesis protein CcmH/NrfG
MAKKKTNYRQVAKKRQKIVFIILTVILSIGLLSSSAVWLGGSFSTVEDPQTSSTAPSDTISELQAKVRSNPQDSQAVATLARVYTDAGKFEEAKQIYTQAVTLNPNDGALRVDQAWNSFMAGNSDDAAAILSEEIKRHPDNKDAHFLYGQVLAHGKKDYKNGIAELEKFIELVKTGDEAAQARQMIEQWKNMISEGTGS